MRRDLTAPYVTVLFIPPNLEQVPTSVLRRLGGLVPGSRKPRWNEFGQATPSEGARRGANLAGRRSLANSKCIQAPWNK